MCLQKSNPSRLKRKGRGGDNLINLSFTVINIFPKTKDGSIEYSKRQKFFRVIAMLVSIYYWDYGQAGRHAWLTASTQFLHYTSHEEYRRCAVTCGDMRSGAVRCGPVRSCAVTCGAVAQRTKECQKGTAEQEQRMYTTLRTKTSQCHRWK